MIPFHPHFAVYTRASLLLLAVIFLLAGCGAPEGDIVKGKRWYLMNNCQSCHGNHGNDGRAPEIANPDMGFYWFVKKLRVTDAPIMPPFPESKISRQDAADIYAYLNSIND